MNSKQSLFEFFTETAEDMYRKDPCDPDEFLRDLDDSYLTDTDYVHRLADKYIGECEESESIFFDDVMEILIEEWKGTDPLDDIACDMADREAEKADPFGYRGISKSNFYGVK